MSLTLVNEIDFLIVIVPGTPTNFSVAYINSTAIVLRWQPPPPEHRNGVITRYVINITGLSEARQEPYVLYTTKTNTVVGSLHPSYTYTCKVAAETNVGPGPFSTTVAQLPEDSMCTLFLCSQQTEKNTVTSLCNR